MKGNSVLFVQVMRSVVALTADDGGESKVDAKAVLLLDRLLTALVDFAPHPSDIDANTAYSASVTSLLSRLARVNPSKAGKQLLVYFEVYSGLLLSSKPTVVRIASQTLSRMLHGAVQPQWIQTVIGDDTGELQSLIKAAEV